LAYKQYTSCSSPLDHIKLTWGAYTYATLFIGLIVAGVANALSIYTLPILIGVDLLLIAFCIWWLYNRLVCLKDEVCAIGVVQGGTGKPNVDRLYTKAGDDDGTMNILLAPGPTDINQPKEMYWNNPVQGFLVQENQAILSVGLGYAQTDDLLHVKALHCEFEGSGIRDVLEWASAILVLLAAALAALLLGGPIISVILWILAAIFTAAGLVTTLFAPLDPGDPTDINQNLGTLGEGDIVVVKGNWIYDSLHVGWNEIHAVHDCQIIGKIDQDSNGNWIWPQGLGDPTSVQQLLDNWCDALTGAGTVQVNGSWNDPANNWVIHPLIDGCKPPVVIV